MLILSGPSIRSQMSEVGEITNGLDFGWHCTQKISLSASKTKL